MPANPKYVCDAGEAGARGRWFDQAGFAEPTLGQLLDDALVRQLMTSDGVEPGELIRLLATIAKSVRGRDGDGQ